jgi:hypothetical protein
MIERFGRDLRELGDGDKPDGAYGPDQHSTDMLAPDRGQKKWDRQTREKLAAPCRFLEMPAREEEASPVARSGEARVTTAQKPATRCRF